MITPFPFVCLFCLLLLCCSSLHLNFTFCSPNTCVHVWCVAVASQEGETGEQFRWEAWWHFQPMLPGHRDSPTVTVTVVMITSTLPHSPIRTWMGFFTWGTPLPYPRFVTCQVLFFYVLLLFTIICLIMKLTMFFLVWIIGDMASSGWGEIDGWLVGGWHMPATKIAILFFFPLLSLCCCNSLLREHSLLLVMSVSKGSDVCFPLPSTALGCPSRWLDEQ